jgi:hypothetical protein
MLVLVYAGVFTDELSGAVAALLAFTGLFGGAAHYGSVLASRPKLKIERATAFGFFVGFTVGALILSLDSVT